MTFTIDKTIQILIKTPDILKTYLGDLSTDWTAQNEGPETWSAYDVIGHLIHGEKTDWIPRLRVILLQVNNNTFEAFDRFAQFGNSNGKTLDELLTEFGELRHENINYLRSLHLTNHELQLKGIHPAFGEVNLQQLLSTWAVHDLGHIAQISRVLAHQYKDEVGPWRQYLGILTK